ncbi:MAG: hypothetical protein EB168_10130, partial [Euryarchaeota archaeon]|nr:hypothetical protein [Euryarchaeota archaeon]
EGAVVKHPSQDRSFMLQLYWEPAGSWNGTTVIPDVTKKGWLPVSQANIVKPGMRVPEGAVWFYNITQEDAHFQELYSLAAEPYSQNVLEIGGVALLYGDEGAYQVTKDTIFWMPNDNYQIEMVSKHPWPDDYVDGDEVRRTMRLVIPAPAQ